MDKIKVSIDVKLEVSFCSYITEAKNKKAIGCIIKEIKEILNGDRYLGLRVEKECFVGTNGRLIVQPSWREDSTGPMKIKKIAAKQIGIKNDKQKN